MSRWLLFVVLVGCGGSGPAAPDPDPDPDPEPYPDPIAIPAWGTDATLDVGTWNLLFFGAPNSGPSDERLQLARVRDVVLGSDADLWGLQEITSASAFSELLTQLPGYSGLLANDSSVVGGSESYHTSELKVGIIFKRSVVQVTDARIVLPGLDHEFAGRPPLQARLRLTLGGATQEAVMLVLHAKANAQEASWERRRAAAAGLQEYLDSAWADVPVLVPGDWNDDVDESIAAGRDTPYRNFVDAAPDWVFPTQALSAMGITSILGYDDIIDHILLSDEVMEWYEAESAMVYRVDEFIPGYQDTTTDHLPVLARFRLGS